MHELGYMFNLAASAGVRLLAHHRDGHRTLREGVFLNVRRAATNFTARWLRLCFGGIAASRGTRGEAARNAAGLQHCRRGDSAYGVEHSTTVRQRSLRHPGDGMARFAAILLI